MTEVVTGRKGRALADTPVLVLSPMDVPERPADIHRIGDDFDRCVALIADGEMRAVTDAESIPLTYRNRPLVAASTDGPAFAMTAVDRHGRCARAQVPARWKGLITRELVQDFVEADAMLCLRGGLGWGVKAGDLKVAEGGVVESRFRVGVPIVDPIHDGAEFDRERVYLSAWR